MRACSNCVRVGVQVPRLAVAHGLLGLARSLIAGAFIAELLLLLLLLLLLAVVIRELKRRARMMGKNAVFVDSSDDEEGDEGDDSADAK